MSAKDVIKVLDSLPVSRVDLIKIVIERGIVWLEQRVNLREITDKLIIEADEKGKIEPWMDEAISLIFGSESDIADKIDIIINLAASRFDLVQLIKNKLNQDDNPVTPPAPIPVPKPTLPKIKGFKITSKELEHHHSGGWVKCSYVLLSRSETHLFV